MDNIYLGGGGSEDDEAALWDEVFVAGQRVTIWPFAMPAGPSRTGSAEWLIGALQDRGDMAFDVWGLDRAPEDVQRLLDSDVLAIPGGNTFDLLRHLQERNLLRAVEDFLAAGGLLYGGSAGAVLVGADIAIAASVDPNHAGITDVHGLDLLEGAVVRPHHQPSLIDELTEWSRERQQIVLGIPERGGLVVADSTVRNVGPADVEIFVPSGQRQSMRVGDIVDLQSLCGART